MRIRIYAGQYYDQETGFHYNYHRYYDPKTGRYLTPDPIGLAGGINPFSYAENNPINLVDPLGLVTAVFTVSDYGVGTHSAVYVDNNGFPAIYDPAGSYGDRASIGSGDLITGSSADLSSYSNYHLNQESRVSIHFFATTPAEESAIFNRAEEMGGGFPGSCTIRVSDAINGIGPFDELGRRYLPDTLYWELQRLQN